MRAGALFPILFLTMEISVRVGPWFVDGNYHRTMGEIISKLAHTGFILKDVVEPIPEPWALKEKPDLMKEFFKPTFLIIKEKKSESGCDC